MATIGVISDTHGNLRSWQKAREVWGDLEMILHCGDVLSHPATTSSSNLADLILALEIPFHVSRGNCDRDFDQERLGKTFQSHISFRWMGRSFLIAHGHEFSNTRDIALAERSDIVITGHTHVASLIRDGDTIYLNPGSATAPRGRDPASVAIITESTISIITLEGLILHSEEW